MDRYIITACLSLFALFALSQPSYIYEGGLGGGTSTQETTSVDPYYYEGNHGGGFILSKFESVNTYLYKGDFGEGYSSLKTQNVFPFFFESGFGEGYVAAKSTPANATLYEGGFYSGYNSSKAVYDGTNFYEGENGEGYTLATKCEDFIWTGTVGTGWGVAENWNFTLVPDINRPVIIPAGAPNYPNVNAGILAIGDNPNSGEFVCKSIWIQEDGELITRINNFVENYGSIQIDGIMRVRNSAPNALWNLENGIIRVSPTGALIIKPE